MHVPAVGKRALQHYGRWLIDTHGIEAPRAFRRSSRPSPAVRPARRRRDSTRSRATGTTPTGSRTARSTSSTRCPTTPTGSCGCRSRPASSVGPAAVGAAPMQLARPRSAARASRRHRRDRARARGEARALARALERRMGQRRGRPRQLPPAERERRQHSRDQRDDPHHERARRRGVRPGTRRVSAARGWGEDTDVFFTTDHGELQGDYGLVFKGPFHTDSLMRLPMVWQPAPRPVCRPRSCASRSASSTSRRRSARSRACPCRNGRRARRSDRARLGPRPRALRMGLAVSRLRHAPADDLPRRLALHRVREVDRRRTERLEKWFAETGLFGGGIGPVSGSRTTAPKASCTRSKKTRTSS